MPHLPQWFNINNMFGRPQTTLLSSPSKSSISSLGSSMSDVQPMMVDSETTSVFHPSEIPRLFALVIAIDNYKDENLHNLTGCKNDGQRFINFLTGVLSVPPSRIRFLSDEKATRAEILQQFEEFLFRNPKIQRDDPIIFYFAGHGVQSDAPPGWVSENSKIEMLCPHDIQTIGHDGKKVDGIPDRTINAMMRKLASSKGDNIIAVFDCCHSGGLARGVESTLRARCIPPLLHPPPADLDWDIWSSEAPEPGARAAKIAISQGFQHRAMESHVILAACRPGEFAMEDPAARDAPGGLFTTALIDCLRGHSMHDTTYAGLFEMLDLKSKVQHPQCEGTHVNRLLFSVNTVREGETTFRVSKKGLAGHIWVSAGSIHGISEGTEFTVVTTPNNNTHVLKAKKVGAFESLLEPSYNITSGRATVSRWYYPQLRVHSPIHYSSNHVAVVPNSERADAVLRRLESDTWELERLDPLIGAYAAHSVRFDADTKRTGEILNAAAHFNSCLHRSQSVTTSFSDKVKIRLQRIGVVQGEHGPVEDDFFAVSNLSSHPGFGLKEATITDLNSQYCFTLENSSDVDLFPYFFYFDPSDYSIQSWYHPPASAPAPLKRVKADGTPSIFAFGYGGFGTDPVEFYLPKGCDKDSGFFKVFLTTTYVEMADVPQSAIGEISSNSSRGLMYTLKGAWTCETFVLTCKSV